MLIDHFRGGSVWSHIKDYFLTSSSKFYADNCQQILTKSVNLVDKDLNCEKQTNKFKLKTNLDTRFMLCLYEATHGHFVTNSCLPLGTPRICNYLRIALIVLSRIIYTPLKNQIMHPHQHLAWDKWIKDAILLGKNQIQSRIF